MSAEFRADGPPVGWFGIARSIAVIGLAGVTTGVLVGGIGARIFMRIAGATGRDVAQGAGTEAGFTVGEVTVGGTIALVLIVGVVAGIFGAALYAVFRPWLAWAGRLRGLLFGFVLFAVASASSDVMNPDNIDFFILGNGLLNVVLIAGLFVGFGVVMEVVHRAIERRAPTGRGGTSVGFVVMAVIGVLVSVPLVITTMFTNSGCDCDPPVGVAWFTVVAGAGTGLWWLGGRYDGLRLPAQIAGYVGLAGATTIGMVRAISDAAAIIT